MSLITLEYVDALESNNEKKVLEFSANLLKEPVNKGSLFVIKVDGKSMEPVIKDRTLVVGDLSQREVEEYSHLVYKEEDVRVVAKAVLSFNSL